MTEQAQAQERGIGPAEHSPASREAIWSAPAVVRRLLADGPAMVEPAAAALAKAERVCLVGTGSSYHAACFAEAMLRAVGTEAWAITAFEFAHYPRPLRPTDGVVIYSHRGAKRYLLEAAEDAIAAGSRPILVTGQGGDVPADLAAEVLRTVPQEVSSMHTVSLFGALTLSALMAVRVGEIDGFTSLAMPLRDALPRLPDALDDMLDRNAFVRLIAESTEAHRGRYFFAGAGPNRATAPESALKAREAAYVTAEGLEIESLLHGPLIALQPHDLVTVIAPPGPALARAGDLMRAAAAIGCSTWLQGGPLDLPTTYADHLPNLPEPLTPFPALTLGQLLAYHLAGTRGTNADSFHLGDPRYQHALDTITL